MTFAERIDSKKTSLSVLQEAGIQKVDKSVGNILKYFSNNDDFALRYLEQNPDPRDMPRNVQKVHRKLYQKYYRTELKQTKQVSWFGKLIQKVMVSFGGISVVTFLFTIAFFVGKVALFESVIKKITETSGGVKDGDLKYVFGNKPIEQQMYLISAAGFLTFFIVTLVYVALKISTNILNNVSHPIEKPMEINEFMSLFDLQSDGTMKPKQGATMTPIMDTKTGQIYICWNNGQWFPKKPNHLFSPGTLRQIELDAKTRGKHNYKDPEKYKLSGSRLDV